MIVVKPNFVHVLTHYFLHANVGIQRLPKAVRWNDLLDPTGRCHSGFIISIVL